MRHFSELRRTDFRNLAELEDRVIKDWKVFKFDILRGNIGIEKVRHERFSDFWAFVSLHYEVRYPDLCWLALIVRLLPMCSAECERMFSLMNRLKTDLRNRMQTSRLFMTVTRLGPEVSTVTDAEIDEWIDEWEAGCSHGRYTPYFA